MQLERSKRVFGIAGMLASLIFITASLCFTTPAHAGWTALSPKGGNIKALTIDSTNTQIIYAAAIDGGVLKSTDGGASWRQSGSGLATSINWLVIDPVNTQTIYAGSSSYYGLYKSIDGGEHWSKIISNTSFYSFAIDPAASQTLYGSSYYGLYKSVNGGANWSSLSPTTGYYSIKSIVIDPKDSQTIYIGTSGDGIHKSMDGGATWQKISSGLTDNYILCLAISPENTQIIYAGTSSAGVYKSTNGGQSWSQFTSGMTTGANINCLLIDPNSTLTIYAGTAGDGIFKSTQGGANWSPINTGLTNTDVLCLAIDPTNTETIYSGTDNGVYKSLNSGTNWSRVGLTTATSVSAFAVDPQNTQALYAGTNDGIYKSSNGGSTWGFSGLTGKNIKALVIDPVNTQTIYAGGSYSGVYKSIDGGISWYQLNLSAYIFYALAIDPDDSQTIYAGTSALGYMIYKSVDGGANWSVSLSGWGSIYCLAVDPHDTQIIYAGYYDIYKSVDNGVTWNEVSLGESINSLAIDPVDSQIIYAGTSDGVYMTVDGGTQWTFSGLTNTHITSVAVDPVHNQTVYAGTSYGEMFESSDGGTSWSQISSAGLTNVYDINSVVIDPENTDTIYIGTDNGVFKSAMIPGAPTGVTATAGISEATVTFTSPADGGSPITSFTATANPGGIAATEAASPITVTGLTNGTAYTFTVTATNAIGTGPASEPSNSVIPIAPSGSVTVTISPTAVVSAGAMWNVDDGVWQSSGATVSNLSIGMHTVAFKDVQGWQTPSSIVTNISNEEPSFLNAAYSSTTTSLTATITPQGAVDAGAQWNIDGGTWNDSGATELGLSAGQHTVAFKDVPGWTKPENQTVALATGESKTINGEYTFVPIEERGSLTVSISPQAAIDVGAKWTIDSGVTWRESGSTATDLTPGQYPLEFKDISGWTEPAAQMVEIAIGESKIITQAYTQASQPELTVVANDPNASESKDTGQFSIIRSGNTSEKLKLYYTVSGTATNGKDYKKLNGKVTIKRNSSFATITVKPKNDKDAEDNETVTITLSNGESATVTIADND